MGLFAKKFIKLNCELFKNKNDLITHVASFAKADNGDHRRRREMLVCAMKMSPDSSAADESLNIDGYVMDVKKEEPIEAPADDGLEEDDIDSDNDDMVSESKSTSQSVTSSNSSSAPSSKRSPKINQKPNRLQTNVYQEIGARSLPGTR